MDTEQQIRLNFMDEAEEYFDILESNLLGLSNLAIDPHQIDLVLRAAHSIKGGAAMMGFDTLSKVAHRLEDFFKILRVRYASDSINAEVETLLLQSVDNLRNLANLNRQQLVGYAPVDNRIETLRDRTEPIFEQLRSHLGDLQTSDENALLAQDEDVDPALVIFEEGVDEILDNFESQLSELGITDLTQELVTTAQELIGFGNIASLDPFVRLCESIKQQAATLSSSEIASLADKALKTWRRSHALVLRGSIEKLPFNLEESATIPESASTATVSPQIPEVLADEFAQAEFDPLEEDSFDLSGLQSAFELEPAIAETEAEFDPLEEDSFDLSGLQSAFELEPAPVEANTIQSTTQETSSLSPLPQASSEKQMVRVPIAQLKQFNNLFEQLILNRNSINLRLQQFQNVITLMSQRVSQMEVSNARLNQWYDRASLEGFLTTSQATLLAEQKSFTERQLQLESSNQASLSEQTRRHSFDALEMDRYTDIHLICQEQIETIVQLQEVATDIKLGLQEINLSVRDLNYTTKSMQANVTRTQMLPFAEAVKRFPRVIRDLSLQFNKQVKLKIIGKDTLLDRSVIEALGDPLMHLLRNAFDHGIEDPQARIAAGKPELGTITIQASNQGTYNVVTISDDGGGISIEKISHRLMQMGLSQLEIAQISEAELLDFIFDPGFSTAKEVTELSGRGVGMDVVRTNLQEIRGDVRVATKPGEGTTFTLTIPFSLSISRVAIVEQAGIVFAIPADSIRELVPLTSELTITSEENKYLSWNQSKIPLIEIEKALTYHRVHNSLNLAGNPAIDRNMSLVVRNEQSFAALQISRFWHEQESTVRSIDSPIPLPPGVVSSVVFGDGKVIPLIEPTLLIQHYLNNVSNSDRFASQSNEEPAVINTILVVDDSINVRRYLSLTLEKAGYLVEQAKDGREAVDKLLGGLTVNAVICDIEMPRLDGYGVLEEVKERAKFADLPMAMLTSRSNEKHRKLAMNLGASAYFTKPYNEQELLAKLAELLPH